MSDLREATARERRHAAAEERTRIAREVHDVVAHSLTVTILQVAGARRAFSTDPQQAAAALERAEAVGRESLDSIRQVVGLLRAADTASAVSGSSLEDPLPQISDIESLVTRYRDAGVHLEASIEIAGVSVGPMTSLTAFRIAQEAVTNSLQHAPGVPVHLRVRHDQDRSTLCVTIENPLLDAGSGRHARGEGHGLTGMAERVRIAGGSLKVGPTPGGTWLVVAEFPLSLTAVQP